MLGTARVNQQQTPVGINEHGSNFQDLGCFPLQPGQTLNVVLYAGSSKPGTVVADAIGVAPAWASSGGQSQFEPKPSYQESVQESTQREIPDVSFDGSTESGVTCYEQGKLTNHHAGTSIAAPCWAGLFAIANQGRVAAGGSTFNSTANPTQALEALYSLPAADFNAITSGYNGYSASAGYNEVTGLGSPIANDLVPDLASYGLPGQQVSSSTDNVPDKSTGPRVDTCARSS